MVATHGTKNPKRKMSYQNPIGISVMILFPSLHWIILNQTLSYILIILEYLYIHLVMGFPMDTMITRIPLDMDYLTQ